MPHYHFNVLDGVAEPDEAGIDLPNLQTAKREARRLAGVMLADSAFVQEPDDEWRVEVTDERGLVLFRLDVMMNDTAAEASA